MMRISLLLFLVSCFFYPVVIQAQSTDEEVLRHLKEVEWPKAYQDQDTALLGRILASEFEMIDASGNVFRKKDEMLYVRDFKPTYETFDFNISRLDIFENNTAIVSGLGVITGSDEDGKYQTTYHSSNVLIKRDDTWQAVSSHVSGLQKNYLDKQ